MSIVIAEIPTELIFQVSAVGTLDLPLNYNLSGL